VAALDAKIAAGAMSDKTARNVWGTVGRMLRDAAHAKPSTGLRCLDANPFRDVQPPERSSVRKAKQFIYPSEFLAFVGCTEVPVRWRQNAAIAVYLGLRDGEQRALRCEHVDLEHGIVNVCEVFDRLTGASREGTKTGASRTVPILPELMPLLREMHDRVEGGGWVCQGITGQASMARGLRTWLRKAGVTRAALFSATAVNLAIRWHDLRATCGTWLAVAGRSSTDIRDVLGHTQVSMTDRYMRNASAVRGGQFGEPFPALPLIRHRSVIDDSALTIEPKKSIFGGADGSITVAPSACAGTSRR
jgi:integrase